MARTSSLYQTSSAFLPTVTSPVFISTPDSKLGLAYHECRRALRKLAFAASQEGEIERETLRIGHEHTLIGVCEQKPTTDDTIIPALKCPHKLGHNVDTWFERTSRKLEGRVYTKRRLFGRELSRTRRRAMKRRKCKLDVSCETISFPSTLPRAVFKSIVFLSLLEFWTIGRVRAGRQESCRRSLPIRAETITSPQPHHELTTPNAHRFLQKKCLLLFPTPSPYSLSYKTFVNVPRLKFHTLHNTSTLSHH